MLEVSKSNWLWYIDYFFPSLFTLLSFVSRKKNHSSDFRLIWGWVDESNLICETVTIQMHIIIKKIVAHVRFIFVSVQYRIWIPLQLLLVKFCFKIFFKQKYLRFLNKLLNKSRLMLCIPFKSTQIILSNLNLLMACVIYIIHNI